MEKLTKKEIIMGAVITVLIFIAYNCRFSFFPFLEGKDIIRAGIYITLYIFWGVSLYSRIVHPQVRRYMVTIAELMVFWFITRVIKFNFSDNLPEIRRYMWYLYYLPMLFIPLFAVLVSLTIGLPEKECLKGKTALLYIPTTVLFFLVMTNDLHQFVFTFPVDAVVWTDSDNNYGYGFGYVLIVIYLLLCAITILVTLSVKSRLTETRRKILFPCIPVLILLLLSLNYLRVDWLYYIAGDMTAVFCLMYAATLELCIKCGLIQSNTGYDKLFMVNKLGAQIANRENVVLLTSSNAKKLTEEQRRNAEANPVLMDKYTLIKSKQIQFGYVLWQEDITELVKVIEAIEENCCKLAKRNQIRQKNMETRKKVLTLQEKNRVSDLLHQETLQQINLIDQMLKQYDIETDEKERRKLLAGVAVVSAYIKRYGNLLLANESTKTADIRDLSRCFDDSFTNLELLGVNCLHTMPSSVTLKVKDMFRVYCTFEKVVETCLYDLKCVWVNGREHNGKLLLNIEFVCNTSLSPLASEADLFFCEDDVCRFTFQLQKEVSE